MKSANNSRTALHCTVLIHLSKALHSGKDAPPCRGDLGVGLHSAKSELVGSVGGRHKVGVCVDEPWSHESAPRIHHRRLGGARGRDRGRGASDDLGDETILESELAVVMGVDGGATHAGGD